MNVVILQNEQTLPPGRLVEYLSGKRHAAVAVLKGDQIDAGNSAVGRADLIVSLGAHVSVYAEQVSWVTHERRILARALDKNVPILGICFGLQMLAALIGGHVVPIGRSYVGWHENDEAVAPLWKGPWFRFHKEKSVLPHQVEVLARSEGIIQAFQYGRAVGLQFHPEIDVTIASGLTASMRAQFALDADEIEAVLRETRRQTHAISAAREALFDEVLRRCGLG